jgi:hypothetical protein
MELIRNIGMVAALVTVRLIARNSSFHSFHAKITQMSAVDQPGRDDGQDHAGRDRVPAYRWSVETGVSALQSYYVGSDQSSGLDRGRCRSAWAWPLRGRRARIPIQQTTAMLI